MIRRADTTGYRIRAWSASWGLSGWSLNGSRSLNNEVVVSSINLKVVDLAFDILFRFRNTSPLKWVDQRISCDDIFAMMLRHRDSTRHAIYSCGALVVLGWLVFTISVHRSPTAGTTAPRAASKQSGGAILESRKPTLKIKRLVQHGHIVEIIGET